MALFRRCFNFFLLVVILFSCTKVDSPNTTPTNPTTPTTPTTPGLSITNFNPKAAMVGEAVMITGTAFGTDSNVVSIKFDSAVGVKPKTITSTELTVIVPSDADTGKIQVTVNGNTVTSTDIFTPTRISQPVLSVNSFSPSAAQVWQEVIITGTAFGTDTNFVRVTFGGSAPIKPTNVTPTTIKVKIPIDAQTGKIGVSVNGSNQVFSTNIFTVNMVLKILDFMPKTVGKGDTLTIIGTLFGTNVNNVLVYFTSYSFVNGVMPIAVTPNKITVIVPAVGQTGKLKVSVSGVGETYSETNYTFVETMTIWRFNPSSARAGEIISVHGDIGIGTTVNDVSLKFNGSANFVHPLSIIYGTEMRVRVPLDAITGKVEGARTGYRNSVSDSIFTVLPPMPSVQPGTWTKRADFVSSGRAGAIAFTIGSRAYVGLGTTNAPFDGFGTNDIWEYDTLYNAWTQKADFGGGKRVNAVAFTIGNKGYVTTGLTSSSAVTNDLWEYEPNTNTWIQKANLIGTSRANAVGFTASNKGYIGSGTDGSGNSLNDFYVYNPTSNSWSQVSSIPGIRSSAFAFVVDNKAYVGAGYYTNTSNTKFRLSDLSMYDPSTNAWTSKAPIPNYNYTCNNASFSIGTKGYIGLGYDILISPVRYGTNQVFEYSTILNSWSAGVSFGSVRSSAVGFSIGNIGYFGLGETIGATQTYRDFFGYTP